MLFLFKAQTNKQKNQLTVSLAKAIPSIRYIMQLSVHSAGRCALKLSSSNSPAVRSLGSNMDVKQCHHTDSVKDTSNGNKTEIYVAADEIKVSN